MTSQPSPLPPSAPRVLIAGRDVERLQRHAAVLAKAGADVCLASNGDEAVIAAMLWEPSLLLLSHDGDPQGAPAMLRALRAPPQLRVLRVAVWVEGIEAGDPREWLCQGADRVLTCGSAAIELVAWARGAAAPFAPMALPPERVPTSYPVAHGERRRREFPSYLQPVSG